jgi:ABC-2 type transport system permease protein
MNSGRLYLRYLGISCRSQLQYRASFVLQTLGTTLTSVGEFLAIWALFARFRSVGGWSLPEVAVFYGVVNITWTFAESAGRGFDNFGTLVKTGEFDRILLRPRATVLQLLGREFSLRRAGRLVQGIIIMGWGWHALDLEMTAIKTALLGGAILGGAALFMGLLVLQATVAFWTVESLEIMNVLTYGGVATAQYPLSIYPSWLRVFFLAVVPIGCVAYFPVVAILGREDPLGTTLVWQAFSPVVGLAFLALALLAWRRGVTRYTSTGN